MPYFLLAAALVVLDQLVKDTYGSAQEVNVDYQPLTAENVQAVTA